MALPGLQIRRSKDNNTVVISLFWANKGMSASDELNEKVKSLTPY